MRRTTTTIIGAGQAGLAMSYALSRRSIDHVVLERGAVGNSWLEDRWDSLRLLTPNWANSMPGFPYQGTEPSGYMKVSEFAAGLDDYAGRINAPILTNVEVSKLAYSGTDYVLETNQGPVHSRSVVMATGACAKPHVPEVASEVPSSVYQLRPTDYKRPGDLPDGEVLVVGASATGVQLAKEIQESGRQVTLAAGWHTRLPRTYRGRDVEWWLDVIGVLDERFDEIDDLNRARRVPSPQLIGGSSPVDLNALQDLGIKLVGRLMDIRSGKALFSGGLGNACTSADLKMYRLLDQIDGWVDDFGPELELAERVRPENTSISTEPELEKNLSGGGIETIVWATGYKPNFDYLHAPVFDARNRMIDHGGVTAAPGLYAMGLTVMRRRRSHQISGVGIDARELAEHLHGFLDGQHNIAA